MNTHWPHFRSTELMCRCGCGKYEMDAGFMEILEELRVAWNMPIHLSSAYRCKEYDNDISNGSGAHTTGRAVDVIVYGTDAYRLLALALDLGFTGIGARQHGVHNRRFVHLDNLPQSKDRNRPWIWTYK